VIAQVADAPLLRAGERVLAALDLVPLYARVDLVRNDAEDGFWLMELELIEPTLYLGSDAKAALRFAEFLVAD
jgi:hypothetical protein